MIQFCYVCNAGRDYDGWNHLTGAARTARETRTRRHNGACALNGRVLQPRL